jgi:hypothetical protein
VSLMTRKNAGRGSIGGAKQRAIDTATQVVPMARSAGMAARQSAEDAAAWAAPRVKDARSWAAPHVEQAGLAVRDKIAPAISDKIAPTISAALVEAAHRLDDSGPAPRRRRWPRVLAGFAMLAAVGSAIGAVIMRRQPQISTFGAEDRATMPGPGSDGQPARGQAGRGDEESEVDGEMRTS